MSTIPVICYGCGLRSESMRITASMKCARCGSDDLDLDDVQKTAASPGTGWTEQRPNRLEGWAVQPPGNLPGYNPNSSTDNVAGENASGTVKCQACNGTGIDTRASGGGYNEIPCRNCHGTGEQATHATSPGVTHAPGSSEPQTGGARWATGSRAPFANSAGRRSADPMGSADDYIRGSDPDYDNRSGQPRKADTRSPLIKSREQHSYSHGNSPLPLMGASCPSCGNGHTQLVRDSSNDAWWHCPSCGPLANVDKNPEINPFSPPADFEPSRKMKTKAGRFRKSEDTGKVLRMTRTVIATNPGLSHGQALTLVRNALLKYPEGE